MSFIKSSEFLKGLTTCNGSTQICASSRTETLKQRLVPSEAVVFLVVITLVPLLIKLKWRLPSKKKLYLSRIILILMSLLFVFGFAKSGARLLIARSEVPTVFEALSIYEQDRCCFSLFGRGIQGLYEHPCWVKFDSVISLVPKTPQEMLRKALQRSIRGERRFDLIKKALAADVGPIHAFRVPTEVRILTSTAIDQITPVACYPRTLSLGLVTYESMVYEKGLKPKVVRKPIPKKIGHLRKFFYEIENQYGCQALRFQIKDKFYLLKIASGTLDFEELNVATASSKKDSSL